MKIRAGYKKTEIGIIPEEWEVKKIGECFEVIMGQSPSSKSYNEEEEGLPLVQGNTDIRNNKVYPRMYTSEITKESYPNDIIMTVRAPVGDVYISDIHSCIGRGICAIRNGNKYIYYYLFNYKNSWERLAQGSTFTAITVKDIKELNIPIPPLKEQEKIVKILSYYDEIIEQQELLIEKEKEFKRGMMQKIFSQELRFKDDNGEEYPEWEEKRLGEIVIFKKGSSISKNDLDENGKNKCILYGELFTKYNELIKKVESKTNIEIEKIGKKYDILMPTSDVTPNGLAKACCLLEEEIILGGDMNILRPKSSLYSCYFVYQLNYEKNKIIERVSGTTVKHIYVKDIENLRYNIPTLEEQQKIANFLSEIDSKIELLEKRLDLIKNEKKGIMQKLLTGEVRVVGEVV